jgi:hypothetical protein
MRSVVTTRLVFAAICGLAVALASASAEPTILDAAKCREPAAVAAPVGAAVLRPGIDAHGRPVVPADLNPPPSWATSPAIDLQVQVGPGPGPIAARRPARLEGTLPLGRLTIEEGEARLNGQPLAADDAPSSARCRDASGDAGATR